MEQNLDAIFKAYDIRGLVGEQLNAMVCHNIGTAFACYVQSLGSSKIVVGRDMRPDGLELSAAFSRGATNAGVDIVDIGLCATEVLYFASGIFDVPGAMFTASHNPAGYNGIKLCGAGATPIGIDTGLQEIKTLAQASPVPETFSSTGTIIQQDLLGQYVDHALTFVDKTVLKPLKVVVDAANGMAAQVIPKVFKYLPFQLDLLYPELDGTFPNHPADPLQPENLRDLQNRVLAISADIGLAFDGDADRVFMVDEKAQPVSGSITTALIAREILRHEPKATIVHNLICSASVPETITKHGGRAVKCRVGHSFMKQKMKLTGAVLGGEHSGHYYFRDHYNADSAIIAALLVLEALSRYGGSFSGLTEPLKRYYSSGEINTKVVDINTAINRVAKAFASEDQDWLDGLTVRCSNWWFNLRPSNTEPLLRLNLEATTSTAIDEHVQQIKALILDRS